MPFNRQGTPTKTEVLAFDEKAAKDVSCVKCGASVGRRHGVLFQRSGSDRPAMVMSDNPIPCPSCGEETNV